MFSSMKLYFRSRYVAGVDNVGTVCVSLFPYHVPGMVSAKINWNRFANLNYGSPDNF